MFISTQNEIVSLMPTARWDRPEQLLGYLEEEERVALEPLLGTALYQHLLTEYSRLRNVYVDITSTTIKPTGKAKPYPAVPYADVTERLDHIQSHGIPYCKSAGPFDNETKEVPEDDFSTIQLIRICQRIEWYKMLSHKAGLLAVSFNEGGGMNKVSADGYDPADDKDIDRMAKDAFMGAGRAVDDLLLFLEADAKGKKRFTEKWQEADAFYLHKDLLFQTARVLNEYLDIKGERMAYVQLVRDIRFCQNTYLKPRVGKTLLAKVVEFANRGWTTDNGQQATDNGQQTTDNGQRTTEEGLRTTEGGQQTTEGGQQTTEDGQQATDEGVMEELVGMLRTALAFYVESRRVEVGPKNERLARRDSMTDAQQAMAMACEYIEENLDALGEAAVGTPIYNSVRARRKQEEYDRQHAQEATDRHRREMCEQRHKKLYTGFPMGHRMVEVKS